MNFDIISEPTPEKSVIFLDNESNIIFDYTWHFARLYTILKVRFEKDCQKHD